MRRDINTRVQSTKVRMYGGYQLVSEFIKTYSETYEKWQRDLEKETCDNLLKYMDSTHLFYKVLLYEVYLPEKDEITGNWYDDFETWLIANEYAEYGESILLYFEDVENNDWDFTISAEDYEIITSVNESFDEIYNAVYGKPNT